MHKVMEMYPEVMVDENEHGLARAQNENYAYLMESSSLEYYTQRVCNVTMVGEKLDDKNYAIGMRKGICNSPIPTAYILTKNLWAYPSQWCSNLTYLLKLAALIGFFAKWTHSET